MTFKEELLQAPKLTMEDVDRVYQRLYIIPTDKTCGISEFHTIVFIASYMEDDKEKFVRFDNGSDVLQARNFENPIRLFHIDFYCGVMRLFNFSNGFRVEQTGYTFVIEPV